MSRWKFERIAAPQAAGRGPGTADADRELRLTIADGARRTADPIEKYGGRFIARGGSIEVLEGDWHPTRLVVVEFPSAAVAREWWNSPEYSEAKRIRHETSEGTLLILEGV